MTLNPLAPGQCPTERLSSSAFLTPHPEWGPKVEYCGEMHRTGHITDSQYYAGLVRGRIRPINQASAAWTKGGWGAGVPVAGDAGGSCSQPGSVGSQPSRAGQEPGRLLLGGTAAEGAHCLSTPAQAWRTRSEGMLPILGLGLGTAPIHHQHPSYGAGRATREKQPLDSRGRCFVGKGRVRGAAREVGC